MMTPQELQTALAPIETQLRRLADLIEALTAPPSPESPEMEPTCLHPLENRISFGLTNGRPDWQCGLCAYRLVDPS